jgi:hypothetical protein
LGVLTVKPQVGAEFSTADLGFRRLGRPSAGVWLLPRRPARDVAWRREFWPTCAHTWRRRSGHDRASGSVAIGKRLCQRPAQTLVRELGRGRSHVLVDAVHGAYSMHDVSRQSRDTRVITQVIGASSRGPVIRTADRQSSIVPTCRLPRGSAGRMPGEDTESNP